jgi:hypothetical protein
MRLNKADTLDEVSSSSLFGLHTLLCIVLHYSLLLMPLFFFIMFDYLSYLKYIKKLYILLLKKIKI